MVGDEEGDACAWWAGYLIAKQVDNILDNIVDNTLMRRKDEQGTKHVVDLSCCILAKLKPKVVHVAGKWHTPVCCGGEGSLPGPPWRGR